MLSVTHIVFFIYLFYVLLLIPYLGTARSFTFVYFILEQLFLIVIFQDKIQPEIITSMIIK